MSQRDNGESVEHPSLLNAEEGGERAVPEARILSSLDAAGQKEPIRRFRRVGLAGAVTASLIATGLAGLIWAAWDGGNRFGPSGAEPKIPAIDHGGTPIATAKPMMENSGETAPAAEPFVTKDLKAAEIRQDGSSEAVGTPGQDAMSSPFVALDAKTGQENKGDDASHPPPDGVALLAAPAGMSAGLSDAHAKAEPTAASDKPGKTQSVRQSGSPSAGQSLESRQRMKPDQRSTGKPAKRVAAKASKVPKAGMKVATGTKPTKGAKAAKRGKPRTVPARTGPRRDDADRDVRLLAAVVAHADARSDAVPSLHRQHALSVSSVPGERAGDRHDKPAVGSHRDVAERSLNESTHDLLKRCRRLGLMEGELCRWRICSGIWETDHACRIARTDASH